VAAMWYYGTRDSDGDGVINFMDFHTIDRNYDNRIDEAEFFLLVAVPAGVIVTSVLIAEVLLLGIHFVIFIVQAREHYQRVLDYGKDHNLQDKSRRGSQSFLASFLGDGDRSHRGQSSPLDGEMLEYLHAEFERGIRVASGVEAESLTKESDSEPVSPGGTSARIPPSRRMSSASDSTTEFNSLLSKESHGFRRDSQLNDLLQLNVAFQFWNFDMFRVEAATSQPLVFMGFVCLNTYSNAVDFDFDKHKLLEFLRDVESSYRQVPYHNALHGATVGRSIFALCQDPTLTGRLGDNLSKEMQFTLVLAGLVHDVNHPGVTATFLLHPGTHDTMDLAIKYNDQSPLENMHLAVTFELMRKAKNAFLSTEQVGIIRSALIRAVLGTDMAKHAEMITKLDALIDNLEHDEELTRSSWYWPATPPGILKTDKQRQAWVHKLQEEFVMEVFLHACDISTVGMPFDQFRKWNKRVTEEFWLQGDKEVKEFGVLISPAAGFDRNAKGESRHGFTLFFMERLALPLFEKLDKLSQIEDENCIASGVDLSKVMGNIRTNISRWKELPPSEA